MPEKNCVTSQSDGEKVRACPSCDINIETDDLALQCALCPNEFHTSCTDIGKTLYTAVTKYPNRHVLLVCPPCLARTVRSGPGDEQISQTQNLPPSSSSHIEDSQNSESTASNRCPWPDYLSQKGLIRKNIKKDGNCLYRAIAYFKYGTQSAHSRVRGEIAKYIILNSVKYNDFLFDGKTVTELCRDILTEGIFGDHHSIKAAVDLYGVNIDVHQPKGTPIEHRQDQTDPQRAGDTWNLWFMGEHYDCVKHRLEPPGSTEEKQAEKRTKKKAIEQQNKKARPNGQKPQHEKNEWIRVKPRAKPRTKNTSFLTPSPGVKKSPKGPSQASKTKTCLFWLAGTCAYTRRECRFNHFVDRPPSPVKNPLHKKPHTHTVVGTRPASREQTQKQGRLTHQTGPWVINTNQSWLEAQHSHKLLPFLYPLPPMGWNPYGGPSFHHPCPPQGYNVPPPDPFHQAANLNF